MCCFVFSVFPRRYYLCCYSEFPLDLSLQGLSCQIDDGSGTECNAYLKSITSPSQCIVDVKFGFDVINKGIACVDIKSVKAKLGPFPMSILSFDDLYSCDQRTMCLGDAWDIPARMSLVNICSFANMMNPWPIEMQITGTGNRSELFSSTYTWDAAVIGPTPVPPSPTPPTSSKEKCSQRPRGIKFSIVPTNCGSDDNELKTLGRRRELNHNSKNNGKKYYACSGSPPANFPAQVVITDNKGNEIFSRSDVSSNVTYDLMSVPTNLRVKIYSGSNQQIIVFHSSCSKPIYTGDTMGSFKIEDFIY